MQQAVQEVASYRFEGIARALSAISHNGDSMGGTTAVFRREKMCVGNEIHQVPVISGNAIRGMLRDCGMLFMLRELGMTLSPQAFHFLTSGGTLTKDTGRGLDIGQARRLRELIPLVGVLGGACGRQILQGKLQVGKWLPMCTEVRELLPERYHALATQSMYDLMDIHSFTRTDDAKSERWQPFLPQEQRALLEAPKVKVGKDGKEMAEKPGVAQQMRYSQEVLIAGTQLFCWLNLNDVTPLEVEAFASALLEWGKTPFIGGQSRHGLGMVSVSFDHWHEITPYRPLDESTAVSLPFGQAYVDHLHTHKDEIIETLKGLA